MSTKNLSVISAVLIAATVLMIGYLMLSPGKAAKGDQAFQQQSTIEPNPYVKQEALEFLRDYQGRAVSSMTAEIISEGIVQYVWVGPVVTTNGVEYKGGIRIKSPNDERESDILFNDHDLQFLLVVEPGVETPKSYAELKEGDRVVVKKVFDLTKNRDN